MVGKNKKRLEITLTTEDLELLNSLSHRFNISKSNVIKQALKVFAAKRKHCYSIYLKEKDYKNQIDDQPSDEDWNNIINN